jgi:hypothetical protein
VSRHRVVASLAVVALVAVAAPGRAQSANPKTTFTSALARVSLGLDGTFGDEGPVVADSLAVMDRARQQWDAVVRAYETGLAAEVASAPPALAARMHLALAGAYLDRNRFRDAQRQLD